MAVRHSLRQADGGSRLVDAEIGVEAGGVADALGFEALLIDEEGYEGGPDVFAGPVFGAGFDREPVAHIVRAGVFGGGGAGEQVELKAKVLEEFS